MRTWFITGVSSGLGKAIAEAALSAGDRVIGTLRKETEAEAFDASSDHAVGVVLDVTDHEAVQRAVDLMEGQGGPIDILVNNAGYGHEGVVEESSLDDLRRQMEPNFFGAVAVTKAVLPYMRARRSGRILNITSMGGLITLPGLAFYHASKFALEGFSSALGKEVSGFGIHVTAVEPGPFRTDWAGRSMVRTPRSIPDYDELMDPVRARRQANSGRQNGDPAKLAQAVLKLVASDNPPVHLLLGAEGVKHVEADRLRFQAELEAWREVSLSTEFTD